MSGEQRPTAPKASHRTLERMTAIINGAVDALVVIDAGGRIILANPACRKLFGRAPEELLGQDVGILMPPVERKQHGAYIERYLATGERHIIGRGRTVEAVHADGHHIPVHLSVSEVEDRGERLFVGFFRDMSVEMRVTAEIRDSEARMRAVLDAAVDAIITIDESGVIQSVNPAFERLFGYSREEIVGQNVRRLMPPPYREQHDEYIRRYLTTGERKIIGIGREIEALRKDGSVFPIDLAVSEFRVEGRRAFTGIVRDISERRELLTRIVEQESLARLGEMATCVAHEVRNPLTGILGAMDILGRRLTADSFGASVVEEVTRCVSGLSATLDDILAFARPRSPAVSSLPVRSLIESVAKLLHDDKRCGRVELRVVGEDLLVRCDPDMLRLIFVNIALNACQAMQGEGVLSVAIENGGSDSISVRFLDSGPGVPPDVAPRIFEPFFTTKPDGTGLGLAIARRLVRLHDGDIELEPRAKGTGAAFRVTLPRGQERF